MRLTAPLLALSLALAVAACGQSDPAAPPASGAPAPAAAPAPEMPVDAPPQEEIGPDEGVEGVDAVPGPQASAASCLSDIGAQASARLVERCRAVSPATRPPCNAANPCALIQGEIDRSCGQYGPGETKPAECAA